MVEDAVDDMYAGCNETTAKLIEDKYFKKENEGKFEEVWREAEECAKRREKKKEKGDEALTKDHLQAICVYTSSYDNFYQKFNRKVQNNRRHYRTSFPFHSLHFWLTSAVQILSNNRGCLTTYRRTNRMFTDENIKTMRFGFFASSSKRTDLTHFGKQTCFQITTCSGAFLKKYPHMGYHEQEVLIPPYEKFTVKKAKNKFETGLADCKVVYILKSAGVESNLNCELANNPTTGSSATDGEKWKAIWGV